MKKRINKKENKSDISKGTIMVLLILMIVISIINSWTVIDALKAREIKSKKVNNRPLTNNNQTNTLSNAHDYASVSLSIR